MSFDNFAIRVTNLSKRYEIYDSPRDRLKQFLVPRLLRLAGKPPVQYFREFWALDNVSFEINKGETVGIIGRNGSGKSTLLQLICGTLTPSHGNIETHGRIAALLELGSGFNPEFTGRENIYLNGAILGLHRETINERFSDIAAFADIGDFIEQPVKTYSSGMYLRLAFAVNIMSAPDIMVVDEALAVGDMNFQAKCMTALTRLQERGTTVLFVSHDIGALRSLCSRGIYLDRGAVQAIGSAGDIASHYIRRMAEEMNAVNPVVSAPTPSKAMTHPTETAEVPAEYKAIPDFENRVAQFRYGMGGVRITFAELLDDNASPIGTVEFNQAVLVRIYLESSIDDEVSGNYYVLDDKRNFILGAGLELAGKPQLMVSAGGRYLITYKTRLPLQEGNYSVRLEITRTVVRGHTAAFIDVIEDAIVFKMARREQARIWAKVFVDNEVSVTSF